MRIIIYIVTISAMVMLSACHTSKRIIHSTPVVNNKDSVRSEYIETVRIDTVIVESEIPSESVKHILQDSTSHLETNFAESDAWINPDGSLGHCLNNKKQSISGKVLVPIKSTERNNSSASVREIPVPYEVRVEVERNFTKWELFRLGAFWYLVSIVFVALGLIFRKPLISTIKKCF